MRNEKALKNMSANLLLEVIICASGFILPRLILTAYGSSVNGLIASITQFLSYLGLAEAGISSAAVVSLYLPIANKNKHSIDSILSATKQFYYRSGMLFLSCLLVMVWLYPLFLQQQLSSLFVREMIIILASSNLVDFFFLGKYKVLLTADQKGYVVTNIQTLGTIINLLISAWLIYLQMNILIVKATATAIYMMRFFLVKLYVDKNYQVNFQAKPNHQALGQRWAALLHQITGIIVNNTDIVLLTIMLGSKSLLEVSVYTVYNMINSAMNGLYNSFINGLSAGFGELASKKEMDTLKCSFSNYEYLFFIILFIGVTCMGILIMPFVSLYTRGIHDVNYIRPTVGILFTSIMLMQNIRTPSLTIIAAHGHYRETRHQAILEAIINLSVSIALIGKYGIVGALIGTLCSYSYRSIEIMIYNAKRLIPGIGWQTTKRVLRNSVLMIILLLLGSRYVPQRVDNYINWITWAVVFGGCTAITIVGVNWICEPKEFQLILSRVTGVIHKPKA